MGAMTKCRIEVIGEMTQERHAAFVMLYYPLIGQDAAILYTASLHAIRRSTPHRTPSQDPSAKCSARATRIFPA